MNGNILVVEDDVHIANIIRMNLKLVQYESDEAREGHEALAAVRSGKYDLVLLDVMIPGLDGFELMERIRPLGVPVIFLTAKGSVDDKVRGLKLGADDYIAKPFEAIELLARIETVLRRYGKSADTHAFRDVRVSESKREATRDGVPIELTPKEFDLLVVLLRNKNIALSREQFLDKVWGAEYYGETRTVDVHIKSLRKKLDWHDVIRTVYKIGYRLED